MKQRRKISAYLRGQVFRVLFRVILSNSSLLSSFYVIFDSKDRAVARSIDITRAMSNADEKGIIKS